MRGLFDPDDLDLLDADLLGEVLEDAGDDYLRAHPEVPRGADGRPLRGMLLPLSAAEGANWRSTFHEEPPPRAYQGPSYNELKARSPSTWNVAEQYWVLDTEGKHAELEAIRRQAEAETEAIKTQLDLNVARAETDYERKRRELAEIDQGFFGNLGKGIESVKKALPWVIGGVVVITVGGWVVPVVVPLLAARKALR